MPIENITWILVGLVFAVVLIAISTNMAVIIEDRELTAMSEQELVQAVRDCWRRDPVQDCYVVEIQTNISNPVAGVPVDWKATSGKVKISREANTVVVAPF